MAKILVVGGYARSGKSTLLEASKDVSKELVVSYVSTSQTLDEHAWNIYAAAAASCGRRAEFGSEQFISLLRSKADGILGFNSRQFKIDVAEKIIVPLFGRDAGIVKPTVDEMYKLYSQYARNVIIESIGGEEWEILERYLKGYQMDYVAFNVRSPEREQPGVDIRQLLPVELELVNDEPDIFGWQEKSKSFLRSILGGANAQGEQA